jgi:hypothetical protein
MAQQDMFAGHLQKFFKCAVVRVGSSLQLVSVHDIQFTNQGMVSDVVMVNEDTESMIRRSGLGPAGVRLYICQLPLP